jgi:hypothetical protein
MDEIIEDMLYWYENYEKIPRSEVLRWVHQILRLSRDAFIVSLTDNRLGDKPIE